MSETPDIRLYVASRSWPQNEEFFEKKSDSIVYAKLYRNKLNYENKDEWFEKPKRLRFEKFDGAWLRLDQPVTEDLLDFLAKFEDQVAIANSPRALIEVGSKEFLENFSEFVPGIKAHHTVESVIDAATAGDVVVKPARGYGGYGILRVMDGTITTSDGRTLELSSEDGNHEIERSLPSITMDYLHRVSEGDKRIVVCGGKIIGAILRTPKQGSWLANMAQGGTASPSALTEREHAIVEVVEAEMNRRGIVLYGLDTLVGNDGERVHRRRAGFRRLVIPPRSGRYRQR
ncbi:MAG: hypothetical protein AAGJ70_04055 [Pseudomonadota bacterium]